LHVDHLCGLAEELEEDNKGVFVAVNARAGDKRARYSSLQNAPTAGLDAAVV
jgi:hypothetical protein